MKKKVSMTWEKLQAHIADPWHHKEETLNTNSHMALIT